MTTVTFERHPPTLMTGVRCAVLGLTAGKIVSNYDHNPDGDGDENTTNHIDHELHQKDIRQKHREHIVILKYCWNSLVTYLWMGKRHLLTISSTEVH